MSKLKELADKYGSDKSAQKHDYTPIYTKLFQDIRFNELNILEMGVDKGASIKMWLDYFPRSNIYGLDRDLNEYSNSINDRRYTFIHSAQDSPLLYNTVVCNMRDKFELFDIIIDDCSHITEITVYSYVVLFELLKSGGLYIIEDCNAKRAKHTVELLGKYGDVYNCGRDSMIVIWK